jgi:peptidoglycan/xylan/chitin deacetylase (PgdA/CDA1 family)
MRASLRRISRAWAHWPLPAGPAVAVIGYHRVDDVEHPLAVRTGTFAAHMAILAGQRRQRPPLGLQEALERLAAGTAPRRSVAVTFDDAWADNHRNALGPLVEHAIPATLYVPSRLLGRPGYLTRSQLREMAAAGVTVGAHSRTHPDLRACGDAELDREVRGSRDDLEELLGTPVTSFAYPTGLQDARVREAVARAGFTSAIATVRGWARPGVDPYRVPRSFMEDFEPATFSAAIRGGLNWLRPVDAVRQRLGR